MKKKYVVLWMSIALLLLSSPVYSQIKLGFQLGANSANANVDWEIEGKTNFFGGILAEFKINDMFYIQPEINFLSKGVTYNVRQNWDPPPYSYIIEDNWNYYEVTTNVLAKFDVGSFTPLLFAGPSLSFLSQAKSIYDGDEYDMSDLFKKFDFSINFGGGIELSLSKSIDIFLMARYSLGLINILKYDAESEYNTRGLAVATGLKFFI